MIEGLNRDGLPQIFYHEREAVLTYSRLCVPLSTIHNYDVRILSLDCILIGYKSAILDGNVTGHGLVSSAGI